MKKFLKMMLVMGLMALAISGCNVFGNDDDDDDDNQATTSANLNDLEISSIGSRLLMGNSTSIASNKDIKEISKATYGDKNIGCYGEIDNTGTAKVTFLINACLETESGSRVATYLNMKQVELAGNAGTGENLYASDGSTTSLVGNLEKGKYKLVISISETDISKSFEITITD